MRRGETYAYRLQRDWDEWCKAAGVGEVAGPESAARFVVFPPATIGELFTLDMNRFLRLEDGVREDSDRLIPSVGATPLGAGYDTSARVLRTVFDRMLPRMRAIQATWDAPRPQSAR